MWQVRLLRLGAALPQYPEVLDLINRRRVGYGFPGMAVVGRLRLRRTTSLLLLQVHHRRNVVERKDLNTFFWKADFPNFPFLVLLESRGYKSTDEKIADMSTIMTTVTPPAR